LKKLLVGRLFVFAFSYFSFAETKKRKRKIEKTLKNLFFERVNGEIETATYLQIIGLLPSTLPKEFPEN